MAAFGFNLGKFFDGPYPLDYLTCAPREIPNKPSSLYGSTIQSGVISIFHSAHDKALEVWEKQVRKGHIKKVHDVHLNATTMEIMGSNLSSVFITTPIGIFQTLGVRLPFLVLVVKNLRRYFMFDVLALDDKGFRRRFRFTNSIQTARVKPHLSVIPISLEDGWNEVRINLPEIVNRTYGTTFREAVRIQIYGNCRLRRVLFSERPPGEKDAKDVIPADVKAFINTASKESEQITAQRSETQEPQPSPQK